MATCVFRKLCRGGWASLVRGTATATGCPFVDDAIKKLPELIHKVILSLVDDSFF